ncbi:MAG: hypothetical protein ONB25_00960 [candidate division KSB1 bacterium]|nr:hypothetical protein [candidate division KSB1 bacterium]
MLDKLLFAYLQARAKRLLSDEPQDFWHELGRVKTVLVALPNLPEETKALTRTVERIVELFGVSHVRFLSRQGQSLPKGIEETALWEVNPNELRFKRFPNRRLWQKIHALRADAFVDLHMEFDLPSAAMAVASGARVRLCFAHERRDPFFNLQVRTSPELSPAKRFDRLITLLESCRGSGDSASAKEPARVAR